MSQIFNADLIDFDDTPSSASVEEFPSAIRLLAERHRPSRMPFFRNLAALDPAAAGDPSLLGQIYLVYQAAMHATRAAVYYLPHLDSPALRKRKLQIFVDDDGLPGGDTHHYQLTRAFRSIGAVCVLDDEGFSDPKNCLAPWMAKPPSSSGSPSRSTRARLDRGAQWRSCRSTGCGLSPRLCQSISRNLPNSLISRNVSRRWSKSATLKSRCR
jgi:hypothetical protein